MRNLKLKLLAGAALSLAAGQASYAADLPVRAPIYKAQPAPAVPIYSWTGFYVGGNIGYSWGRSDVAVTSVDFSDVIGSGTEKLRPRGIIGGLQAGYNWQFNRNWVWGLETDFQWSGQKHTVTRTGAFDFSLAPDFEGSASGTAALTIKSQLSWLGTARGRIGFVADAAPSVLWYGTGGLAYGRVKTSVDASATGIAVFLPDCEGPTGCPFTAATSFSQSKTKVGWAAGVGGEGAIGGGWTWKVEYLYVDLGTAKGVVPVSATACITGITPPCATTTGSISYSNRMTDNIVRIGLNYRWGS